MRAKKSAAAGDGTLALNAVLCHTGGQAGGAVRRYGGRGLPPTPMACRYRSCVTTALDPKFNGVKTAGRRAGVHIAWSSFAARDWRCCWRAPVNMAECSTQRRGQRQRQEWAAGCCRVGTRRRQVAPGWRRRPAPPSRTCTARLGALPVHHGMLPGVPRSCVLHRRAHMNASVVGVRLAGHAPWGVARSQMGA